MQTKSTCEHALWQISVTIYLIEGNHSRLAKDTFFWEVHKRKDTKLSSNQARDSFYTFFPWQMTSLDIDTALYFKYQKPKLKLFIKDTT